MFSFQEVIYHINHGKQKANKYTQKVETLHSFLKFKDL